MKLKTKRRALDEIPLASTADIAFLLIVFYLAASSLLEFRGVQIPLPKKDAPPMQVLRENIFRINLNAAGDISVENRRRSPEELRADVREALKKNSELVVVLRADAAAPAEAVTRAVHLLQRERIVRISIGMEGGR